MNNKLYTEYQIRKVIELSRTTFYNNSIMSEEGIMSSLDPIEIPSDEEIINEAKVGGMKTSQELCFQLGAKWMRDKIQGGNNEQ